MDGKRYGRALLASLVTGAALTAPAGATAAGGPSDFAVGSVKNQVGHISFSAHGGPSPFEPARGHFTAKGALASLGGTEAGAFQFEGPVTCLTVVGNRAGLYYPLRSSDPPEFKGQGIFITLQDNGNLGNGLPDQVGFVGPVPAPPNPLLCPPGPTPLTATSGNITIRDVP